MDKQIIIPVLLNLLRTLLLLLCISFGNVNADEKVAPSDITVVPADVTVIPADVTVVPTDATVVKAANSEQINEEALPIDEVPEQKSTALTTPVTAETSPARLDLKEVKINEPVNATETKVVEPVAVVEKKVEAPVTATETKVVEPVAVVEKKIEAPVATTETKAKIESKEEVETKKVAPTEEIEGESFETVPVEMATNDDNVAAASIPTEQTKNVEVIKETIIRTPNAEIVGGSAPLFR